MKTLELDKLPKLNRNNLAVVGHVEWVDFISVDNLPRAGEIAHGENYMEGPAGGGGVAAIQLTKNTESKIHLLTALADDEIGHRCHEVLKGFGIELHVTWKKSKTRKGISFVDEAGERAITVIGERIEPLSSDNLPWGILEDCDGVYVTATDSSGLQLCRKSKVLVATPRLKLDRIKSAKVKLNALIGSGLDPDEKVEKRVLNDICEIRISTKGEGGGEIWPEGNYEAIKIQSVLKDSYGCGDSFAAGVTAGLAAEWTKEEAISLGANWGAKCAQQMGPY